MTTTEIQIRVNELDQSLEYSYSEIFLIVCKEFNLKVEEYTELLGCQCPFGLIGFLQNQ